MKLLSATDNNHFCIKCGAVDKLHRHHILSDLYFDKRLNKNCHENYDKCDLLCDKCHGIITSINHRFRKFYWQVIDIVKGRKEKNASIEEFERLKLFHNKIYERFLNENISDLANKPYRKELAKELVRIFLQAFLQEAGGIENFPNHLEPTKVDRSCVGDSGKSGVPFPPASMPEEDKSGWG